MQFWQLCWCFPAEKKTKTSSKMSKNREQINLPSWKSLFSSNSSSVLAQFSSDRFLPNNQLDVRKVSALNPKEERQIVFVHNQKNSCGELEFSSDNHADVFSPKVQKIFVQYPRTKKKHFFLQKCFLQMIPVDTIDAVPKDRPKVFSQNSEKLPLKTWKES